MYEISYSHPLHSHPQNHPQTGYNNDKFCLTFSKNPRCPPSSAISLSVLDQSVICLALTQTTYKLRKVFLFPFSPIYLTSINKLSERLSDRIVRKPSERLSERIILTKLKKMELNKQFFYLLVHTSHIIQYIIFYLEMLRQLIGEIRRANDEWEGVGGGCGISDAG